MKILSPEQLISIFNGEIPQYAVELMLSAPDNANVNDVINGVTAAKYFNDDDRVKQAVTIARILTVPLTATAEQEGEFLTKIALVTGVLFKYLDERQA
jgi:hypothetical protein